MSKKNELAKTMANMEFYLEPVMDTYDFRDYEKFDFKDLAGLGVAFDELARVLQTAVTGEGGSGLYYVNTMGKNMFAFKDGSGFMGALKTVEGTVGGGQARIQLPIADPATLFMAAALMQVEAKLNKIEETQKEILQFMDLKEKAELQANLHILSDIIKDYKFNWDNEQFLSSNHIKTLDIKQKAEQGIILAKSRIESSLKKKRLIDKDAAARIKQVESMLNDYQTAVYSFAMASYIDVMLLENFREDFLKSVIGKIEDYALEYRVLYTSVYDRLGEIASSSVKGALMAGLAGAGHITGKAVEKIPLVNKGPIDEALIAAGDSMAGRKDASTEKALAGMTDKRESYVTPFIDGLKQINALYNKPIQLMFNKDSLYIGNPEEVVG